MAFVHTQQTMAPSTSRIGSSKTRALTINSSDDDTARIELTKDDISRSARVPTSQEKPATTRNSSSLINTTRPPKIVGPPLGMSISLPHLPLTKSTLELGGASNLESKNSVRFDTKPHVMEIIVESSTSSELIMPLQNSVLDHAESPDKAFHGVCLETLDRELDKIRGEIEADQALMTSQLLQDTQSQLAMAVKNLSSMTSGTTSLQSLRPMKSEDSSSSLAMVHHVGKKRSPTKRLAAKSIRTMEKAVPRYNYYIEIERSVLVNNPQLPPNPSVQDNTPLSKVGVDAAIYKSNRVSAKLAEQSRENESLSRLGAYLPQVSSAYQKCKATLENHGIYKSLSNSDPKHPIYHVEKSLGLPAGSFADLEAPATKPATNPPVVSDLLAKSLETYAQEGCLICSAHHCHIHGKFDGDDGEESDTSDRTDEDGMGKGINILYQLYNMPYTRMQTHYRGRNDIRSRSESDSSEEHSRQYYCSAACYLDPSNKGLNDEGTWTEEEDAVMRIQVSYMQIGKNRRAPCLIASMLRKSCSHVQLRVEKLSKQNLGVQEDGLGDYKGSKKFSWDYFQREHVHHERPQPMPCHHPGLHCLVAGKKCTCVSNGLLCDKFCACPQNCCARYRGCTCTEPCLRSKCLCRQLNRECDPDLCQGCGAAESVKSHGPTSGIHCRNCEIQRGVGKKVLVGESSIEGIGYGLYLAEPIQKGDFIAEYVGEIIRENEIRRRDALVKRLDASYYFDLNKEVTIDALRLGNATRFINDSELRKNCEAKVLLVNCEHRIGFFATKNADAGTELFFYYGKNFHDNEKLKEDILSSDAGRKSSKPQGRQTLGGTIDTAPTLLESVLEGNDAEADEDDDLGYVFGDINIEELEGRSQRKRVSDDDDDYVEEGPKRQRAALRNRLGLR